MTTRVLHVSEALGGGVLAVLQPLLSRASDSRQQMYMAYGIRPETPNDVPSLIDSRVSLLPAVWAERSLSEQVRGLRKLRDEIRRVQPDLIHAHSSFSGVASVLAAGKVPVVYTPHGYAFLRGDLPRWKRSLYRQLERFVARKATLVVGCSRAEASEARKLGAPRVSYVANGISELDMPVVRRQRATRAKPVVIAGGRVSAQRQPAACARILGALSRSADVRWVGGAGEGSSHLDALRDGGIQVTGWLERQDSLTALKDADVYLHWTGWDGLPLSILEAFASDTVVVASDIAPNRELLDGRQICQSEADAIGLIRRLTSDADLRASLLADQRIRAAKYSAARMCSEWIELYQTFATAPPVDVQARPQTESGTDVSITVSAPGK